MKQSVARDNVIQMPPTRRPFMLAHPEGAPEGLSIDPDVLSGAAMCLADLRGERLQDISAQRLEEYRGFMLLAAWLADYDASILVAYHVEQHRAGALAGASMVEESPLHRLRCVELTRNGLMAARDAVAGLRPHQHAAVVGLCAQDDAVRHGRRW